MSRGPLWYRFILHVEARERKNNQSSQTDSYRHHIITSIGIAIFINVAAVIIIPIIVNIIAIVTATLILLSRHTGSNTFCATASLPYFHRVATIAGSFTGQPVSLPQRQNRRGTKTCERSVHPPEVCFPPLSSATSCHSTAWAKLPPLS